MPTLERTETRHRPTVAVIDLDAIRHNVRVLTPPDAQMMAVVKANGYGHGDAPVARAALDAGATWLGVALVEEGVRLRESGLEAPILVLTELPPGAEADGLAGRLTPTVYTRDGMRRLSAAVAETSGEGAVGVHVKVDTGMHRVGIAPDDALELVIDLVRSGLAFEGLWTHFAKSEDLEDPFTLIQLERFGEVVERLRAAGLVPRYLHAANSGAMMAYPQSHFDLVRLGVAMYGLSPGPQLPVRADLRPAMSWRSAVSHVKRLSAGEAISYGLRYRLDRPSTVATVPVGYADGYSRLLSNRAHVLIRGRRYPVAGTVTMDQLMVDCGDEPVQQGDEVVLLGRQGDQEIAADELAGIMGTINYEVVCGVSERVPREYTGSRA